MQKTLCLFFAVFSLGCGCGSDEIRAPDATPQKPNILLILAEDMSPRPKF